MIAARRRSTWKMGAIGVLSAMVAAGCSTSFAKSGETTIDTVPDVGLLPGDFTTGSDAPVDSVDSVVAATDSVADTTEVPTSTSVPDTIAAEEPIGAKVTGNRLLIIGDSLTASVSKRYGGEACASLVPLGWEVEVDAETGRFIDFGARVLDKRLDAGWDAAIVFLGNNYGYDRGVFQLALHSLLLRLYPRPTVVVTTSLFRPEQAEANAAIVEEAEAFDNVSLIDWQTISEDPALTGGDDLHLSELGRDRLGFEFAVAMGPAPKQPGKCLGTDFHNDSAGSPNGPGGNKTPKTPTKTTTKPTPTTAKPSGSATTTTAKASIGATTTTAKPTSTPVPTPVPTTVATPVPTTAPATTQPATTQPATTQPATTQPATTQPATTQPAAPVPPADSIGG